MSASPLDYEFTPSPYFLVRMAGLSTEDVAPLHSPRTSTQLDRVLDGEQHLADAAHELTESLGTAVAEAPDASTRRSLLRIRRDVHNLRAPKATTEAIDPGTAARLRAWLVQHELSQRERAAVAEIAREELRQARRQLRLLGRDHRVRQGIQLGSPLVDQALPGYLEAQADAAMSKRLRGVERSLLHYVFRAAFKTSPFSSFTRVCLGRYGDGDAVLALPAGPEQFTSQVMVNLAALGTIAAALPQSEETLRRMPVQLTPGWRVDGGRIKYVRRQYGYNSDPTAPTVGLLEEVEFSVPRGQVLDEILDIAGAEPGLPLRELVDRLHSKDPAERPRDKLAAYLARLLDLGLLLSPAMRIDPSAPDPATDFATRLGPTRVADRIAQIARSATEFGTASLPARAELAAKASQQVVAAQQELGKAAATEPRTVFYEDSVCAEPVTLSTQWTQSALQPQLERLATVLPAFDPLVSDRILARGYFLERYGSGGHCADIAGFAHEFQRRCASWLASYERRDLCDTDVNPLGGTALTALRRARELLADDLRQRDQQNEVCLDDELLDRLCEPLAEVAPKVLPAAFFLQLARQDGDWLAVLNFAYTGLGMPIGRFSYPLQQATGLPVAQRLREHAERLCPDSAVFAELTGGYDATNLSWHAPLTPYQIVGPAEISFRPETEQLPVDDLELVHQQETGELLLRSKRLGAQVIPVYLGSLMPVALPEVQRTLLALSCTVMPNLNLSDWTTRRDQRPRVRYRNVVLQRRGWTVPAQDFPAWDKDITEWLLDWRRWWRALRLPAQLFYTLPARAAGGRARVAEKPQYVSADSVLSLLSFGHDLRSARGPVRLTEMLPTQHDLAPAADGTGYASELCIELTGVRRR